MEEFEKGLSAEKIIIVEANCKKLINGKGSHGFKQRTLRNPS
mgnify:CR=1 FL=1